MGRRAEGTDISVLWGPDGEPGRGLAAGDLRVEEDSGDGHLSPEGPRWDEWGGGGG